jgi:hypothetical protein
MRRILNLNQTGVTLLKVIGMVVVVIPAILYGTSLLLNGTKVNSILLNGIKLSFAIGALVFVILLALILVEQIQDHYFDLHYQKNKAQKLPLANGTYECQYCGNQMVREADQACQVCGKELKPARSNLAKQI